MGKAEMKNYPFSRILFYVTVISVTLMIAFGYGLYSATSKNRVYRLISHIKSDVESVLHEKENLTKTRPVNFLQPARYDGSGVTVNMISSDQNDLVFLSGFFEGNNELRLIRRDGEIVARWIVKYSELFPDPSYLKHPPATDWNTDIHGAIALPDGSVIFNFDYVGLVKLDRCGKVLWTIESQTHHSVELAEDGSFWVPGRNLHEDGWPLAFPPFIPPFNEDTLLNISNDGAIISEISVPGLFYDNNLDFLLTSNRNSLDSGKGWGPELVHLNKIAELKTDIADDFPLFEAGDLLLSLRNSNMVLVVDPDARIIKWWKTGPWKRQHDPEFFPGGKIVVFNNNAYNTVFSDGDKYSSLSRLDIPRISNIIELDPVTGQHKILYGGNSEQELLSVIRGKHEFMSHGGLLITEFEGGRILETDAGGQIIWEYINRYDQDEVAELTEARVYSSDYFGMMDWSCDPGDI